MDIQDIVIKYSNIEDKIPSVWKTYEDAAFELSEDIAYEYNISNHELIRVISLIETIIGKNNFNFTDRILQSHLFTGLYPNTIKAINITNQTINNNNKMERILNHINKRNEENNAMLTTTMHKIRDNEDQYPDIRFLKFMTRYVEWNAFFPGCVSYLVGAIHLSDIFQYDNEWKRTFESTHADIASYIFAAAEDEYGFEGNRHTHRKMALEFLDGMERLVMASHLDVNFTPNSDFVIEGVKPFINEYHDKIKNGYGVGQGFASGMGIEHIFSAIGFHMASEMLATNEFTLIDEIFNTRMPHIKKKLQNTGSECGLYDWVTVHIAVEVEHFNMCLKGAELALDYIERYYPQFLAKAEASVIEGFDRFAKLQEKFFTNA